MSLLEAYIPSDRRQATARGEILPDRATGAVMFADISGFTRLTDALVKEMGPRRGIDEFIQQLNRVYDALIAQVDRYGGSVVSFSGDAITCWFEEKAEGGTPSRGQVRKAESFSSFILHPSSFRAVACALEMQQTMNQFAAVKTPAGATVSLAIKISVAAGPVRRFLVGDPHIQYLDILAGQTLDRLAQIDQLAQPGEILVGPQIVANLGDRLQIAEWREEDEAEIEAKADEVARRGQAKAESRQRFAVITDLSPPPSNPPPLQPSILPPLHPSTPPPFHPSTPPLLTEAQIRPWLLPPVYDRLKSGQGQFLAELRPAVALFVKFGGLDYDGDEAAGIKLDAYIRWAQHILALYEGSLIQLTTGDKGSYFYAVFGAPQTHDDDADRAVAAALVLRSPPPGLEFITPAQIGLTQSRMRVGAYGGSTRCTYGALGDEVNIAARLMSHAQPGQILVSQRVAAEAGESYHFNYLGPVSVKGRPGAMSVFEVLGRKEPSAEASVRLPLVGREAELARIQPLLDAVLTGAGQILRLEGEAGVGKSRLAAELVEQAQQTGLRVVQAGCQSVAQSIAYYPWRQLFRALFELPDAPFETAELAAWTARQISRVEARLNQINPAWLLRLPLLGDLLGLPIPDNPTTAAFEPQLRREALLALAVEIIQSAAQRQPLLILIEDVHWMDEASLALTSALSRVMAEQPLLLALVHRPPPQPLLPDLNALTYHHHLLLSELAPPEIALLVTQRLQPPPSASALASITTLALAFIQTQAQGNPFFTEELVDALREAGHLQRPAEGPWDLSTPMFNALRQAHCLRYDPAQGQWTLRRDAPLSAVELGLPDSVHGLVLARLDRLPEAHKLTLKVASVIGPAFEFELLAQAHPAQPDQEALLQQLAFIQARDFIRQELPAPQLSYTFKHHITQEVTYENLLGDQQRQLHHAVGDTLERLRPEAVEPLAYHYSRSGLRDKTLFYLDKAAQKTQREYANETALNYYSEALVLEERWEWRRGQAEILHILGQREEERASLELLEVNLSGGAGEQGGRGDVSPAPPPPRSPAAFELAYLWGQYYEAIGNYAQAQAAVEKALAASRELEDLAAEVRCLAQLGLVAFRQGDYERAKVWYSQALALFQEGETYADEVTRAFTQAFDGLGAVHYEQGAYEQATNCYQQALTLSRLSGDRPGEANTLFGLGVTAYYQRHFSEAQSYFQQTLTIRQAIGDRAGEGIILYHLAEVFTDAGDYSSVQKYFAEALTILQATGNRWQQVYILNGMAVIYLTLGDLSRAESCLEQGLQLAQEIGAEESRAYLLVNLGLVLQLQGNLAAAEQVLVDGLALTQTLDNKRLVSSFLTYLSAVYLEGGRPAQAVEHASTALTLRNELGLRLSTTFDLTTLAAAHLTGGEVTKALRYAEPVLSILEECGGEGPEFPERDYWISYQVLVAAGQAERAKVVLQAAYYLVMTRANRITDPALRQSFLERVEVNREIVAAYRQVLDNQSEA